MLAVATWAFAVPLAACGLTSSAPAPTPNAETQTRPPSRPAAPPTRAPLVASSCAQRIVRHGDGDGGAATEGGDQGSERRRSVAFHNRCGFPIRVLHAVRSDGRPTEVTEMLGVGETSNFTRIEDGYDRPGYVVCSYESVPASYPCRLGRGR